MRGKWLVWALAAICLVSVAAGIITQRMSKDTEAPDSGNNSPPFFIAVYTQSPEKAIGLELDLYRDVDSGITLVDLYLSAPADDDVTLLASQQDTADDVGKSPSFAKLENTAGTDPYSYYLDIPNGAQPSVAGQLGKKVATFKVAASSLIEEYQEVVARLPLVGQSESSSQFWPAAATAGTTSGIYLSPILGLNYKLSDRTPSHYQLPDITGSTAKRLYWNPERLSTVERVLGVSQMISGWNISDTPSNGVSEAGDYMWQGDYGLAGSLTAVSPSAVHDHDNDEFLSGIAWATGAAAFIALLQECREGFPFKRVRQAKKNVRPSGLGWPAVRKITLDAPGPMRQESGFSFLKKLFRI